MVKTACGTVLNSTLLDENVASLDHCFEQKPKWHLIIRIVPSQSISRTESSNDNMEFFDMLDCANRKVCVKSKYTTKKLKVFIDGFNGCCSTVSAKKRYLQKQGAKKILFDEQVNNVLCHFLEQNNMGVADTYTTEKASCESAVGRVVQSLLFLRKNIGSMLVNNSSIIYSNFVLKYIQSLVPTKVHNVEVKLK